MHLELTTKITTLFENNFGGTPTIKLFAPGRANIIGEHTDYNQGFVLPFAISQGIVFAGRKNESKSFHIYAVDYDEHFEITFPLQQTTHTEWSKYMTQVLHALAYTGGGMDIVFGGNLPVGAGISSSSALTCGFVFLINTIANLELKKEEMLNFAVKAEKGTGVQGGMMDQFTIFFAEKDKAILLDCGKNQHEFIDLPLDHHQFYLLNTNVKHNLVLTDYNSRRNECEEALLLLQKQFPEIQSLSDIKQHQLPVCKNLLSPTLYNRVDHVVTENQRVLDMVSAMSIADFNGAGQLLYQSHKSLSECYEVSCPELDFLVSWATKQSNICGARMMGGGFGGCTINLVKGHLSEDQMIDLKTAYEKLFGHAPDIFPVQSSEGIRICE